MTITNAKKQWKVSDERMIALLENGIIRGVEIVDGKIIMPDHTTIKLPNNNQKITVEYVVKSILEMCDKMGYVDNKLLGISESDFEHIITTMEHDDLIYKKTNEYPMYTNRNYMITEKGYEKIKKKKFVLSQIIVGFTAKVFSVKAVIEKE